MTTYLTFSASQLIIDVKPPVVNGSMYPHRNLTITCAIQSDAVLHDIFNMQLLRKTRADERLIPIAELPLVSHPSPRFVPNAPADIVERSSLSGKCDTNILTNNFMKLEIDIALVKCADAGIYSCSLAYQARSLHSKLISTSSNLTVFLPGMYVYMYVCNRCLL